GVGAPQSSAGDSPGWNHAHVLPARSEYVDTGGLHQPGPARLESAAAASAAVHFLLVPGPDDLPAPAALRGRPGLAAVGGTARPVRPLGQHGPLVSARAAYRRSVPLESADSASPHARGLQPERAAVQRNKVPGPRAGAGTGCLPAEPVPRFRFPVAA